MGIIYQARSKIRSGGNAERVYENDVPSGETSGHRHGVDLFKTDNVSSDPGRSIVLGDGMVVCTTTRYQRSQGEVNVFFDRANIPFGGHTLACRETHVLAYLCVHLNVRGRRASSSMEYELGGSLLGKIRAPYRCLLQVSQCVVGWRVIFKLVKASL